MKKPNQSVQSDPTGPKSGLPGRKLRGQPKSIARGGGNLYDYLSVACFCVGRDGAILHSNPAAAVLLGGDPDKRARRRLGALVVPSSRAVFRSFLERVFCTAGQTQQCEVRLHTPDDAPLWIQIDAASPDGVECQAVALDITQRKLTETALRETETRLRDVFDNSPVGESITGLDGSLKVNRAFCEIVGYSEAELRSMNWMDITHPDDVQASLDAVRNILSGEISGARFEKRYIQKNGRLVWVDMTTALRRDAQGKPLYFLTTINDITERKQAEDRLLESEARYRGLFDSMEEGLAINEAVRDEQGDVVDYIICSVNPAFEKQTIYTTKQALGKRATEVYGLSPAYIRDWWRSHAEFKGLARTEMYHQPSQRWFSITTTRPEGNRFVTIFTDITERKQTEAALKQSEEKFRVLTENSVVGVYIIQDDKMAYVNRSLARAFGYAPEEIIARLGPRDLIHPDDIQKLTSRLQGYLEGLVDQHNHDYRAVKKDGSLFYIEVYSVKIDYQGRPAIMGTLIDVTERKLAETALHESEERFRALIEQAPVGISISRDGLGLFANQEFLRIFGLPSAEGWAGAPIYKIFAPQYQTDSRERTRRRSLGLPVPLEFESVGLRSDGTEFPMQVTTAAVKLPDGQANIGFVTDITERKRAEASLLHINRLYATVSQIDQALVRAKDRDSLFAEICRVTIEHGKFRMAWVGLIDESGQTVRPVVFAGEEQGYLTGLKIVLDDPRLRSGPTGRSIREERCVICEDIANDPHMAPWRQRALERGFRSSAAVPIRQKGRTVGAFTVYSASPAGFGDDDQKLLDTIGQDISYALDALAAEYERRSADDALRKSQATLTAVVDSTHDLIWSVDPQSFGLQSFNQGLFNYFRFQRNLQLELGMRPEELFPTDEFVQLWCDLYRRALAEGSYTTEYTTYAMTSILQLSFNLLKRGDEVFGISVFGKDITESKQAEATIHRQLDTLNALRDIDRAIASTFDLRTSIEALLARTISLLDADAVAVLLVDTTLATIRYAGWNGFRTNALEAIEVRLGDDYSSQVILQRRLIQVPDLAEKARAVPLAAYFNGEDFVGYYGTPLILKGKVIGALEVFQRRVIRRDQEWLDLFDALGGQAAIAIDNSQLFTNLQRANYELEIAYESTIEGWSHALDLRDKETEGHSQRVTENAVRLGKAMGIEMAELVRIRRGALLHDIGKMGVPDHILLKPDRLTDDEWDVMKRHPQFAFDMLAPIAYLRPSLDIPYCHHEKWDGSGYPRGLAGEQIPLAARIFAVVDVFDALVSERPYRQAWPKQRALQHIQSLSGSHLDPAVVDLFLANMNEMK